MKHMSFVLIALAALALIVAGCDREITGDVALADQSASDCFDCHSDQDFDLVQAEDQFEVSTHAHSHTVAENRLTNPGVYVQCERCHTNEGFVANVTGTETDADHFTNFDCFTCHAPHSTGTLNVRIQEAVSLMNGVPYDKFNSNLCVACHQSRRDVSTYITDPEAFGSVNWGPHYSTQADMMVGTNGYEYEGYDYASSAHTTVVDSGCVECHMADPSVFGPVGGHTFNVAVEEEVFDLELKQIPDSFEVTAVNFGGACGKCHESFETINPVFPADIDYDDDGISEGVQTEVIGLLQTLEGLLVDAGMLVLDEEEGHLAPNPDDTVSADSAGALWNYLFVRNEGSFGIHNTNYAVTLLQSSIDFLGGGTPAVVGRPSTFSAH